MTLFPLLSAFSGIVAKIILRRTLPYGKVNKGHFEQQISAAPHGKGWTQSDLVEKMYLSQRTISHIEKGDCTLSNLIQLADLYEVSVDYLLGRSTERRFITLGLDPLTTDIIEQLNLFTTTEKEILLKHLKLSNALKSGETTTV